MRALALFTVLLISIGSRAQAPKNTRYLTYRQNEVWLKSVQVLTKLQQLEEIKRRFFSRKNYNAQSDSSQYSPLIIVNGVALNIPETLNDQYISEVSRVLNNDSFTQIIIVDKLSEEWIFCKPFAGVILMTMDKRSGNRLLRLKLQNIRI